MNQPDFSLSGAVDLGARKAANDRQSQTQQGQPGQQGGASTFVFDVTEETFNTEVVERSRTVPIVLDVWADWCQPCKQLSPILEKLANEDGGQWLLAKVDADANQRLTQALQVQSLPTVLAVIGGQLASLFNGALPESQVRQVINQLLEAVSGQQAQQAQQAQQGQQGQQGEQPQVQDEQAAAQQPGEPEFADAAAAIDRGDFDAAAAAYQQVLDRTPGDPTASGGLALVELLRRSQGVDEAAARQQAASQPEDVDAQCRVADLDMLSGRVDDAFDRLVGTVRRTGGDERDRARVHLLGLFEVLPDSDPRVGKARSALASALF